MISSTDFAMKQIVFMFSNNGEKLSFQNDNMIIKDKDGCIKFQCTCYRLFLVFVIGNCSITSGLIQRAHKFGFSIVLMNQNLKPYQFIGNKLEGNTVLRRTQYEYQSLDIARHIISNKLYNQKSLLLGIRNKNDYQTEAILHIDEYITKIENVNNLHELMGIEGNAARVFFPNYFINVIWIRRSPRTKIDIVNSLLDIGYMILFSIVDSLLNCFGFDNYYGIMHTNFYMRKSLTCDIVEPFRCIVEREIRKAINLRQIHPEDFLVENDRYVLKWEKNAYYVSLLAKPIIEHKSDIHLYVQSYYRAFMKHKSANEFPSFII